MYFLQAGLQSCSKVQVLLSDNSCVGASVQLSLHLCSAALSKAGSVHFPAVAAQLRRGTAGCISSVVCWRFCGRTFLGIEKRSGEELVEEMDEWGSKRTGPLHPSCALIIFARCQLHVNAVLCRVVCNCLSHAGCRRLCWIWAASTSKLARQIISFLGSDSPGSLDGAGALYTGGSILTAVWSLYFCESRMLFVTPLLGCPRYTDRLRILQAWLLVIRLNSCERPKCPSRMRRE